MFIFFVFMYVQQFLCQHLKNSFIWQTIWATLSFRLWWPEWFCYFLYC
jgi:hypothetical protein